MPGASSHFHVLLSCPFHNCVFTEFVHFYRISRQNKYKFSSVARLVLCLEHQSIVWAFQVLGMFILQSLNRCHSLGYCHILLEYGETINSSENQSISTSHPFPPSINKCNKTNPTSFSWFLSTEPREWRRKWNFSRWKRQREGLQNMQHEIPARAIH